MRTIKIVTSRQMRGEFDTADVDVEVRCIGDRLVFDLSSGARLTAIIGRMEDGNIFHVIDGGTMFTDCVIATIGHSYEIQFMGRRPWP